MRTMDSSADPDVDYTLSKEELERSLRSEWGQWEQLLALVPTEQLEVPMTPEGWSLRDLLAHLLWYEQECLALCREGAVAHPAMWGRAFDAINADIWQAAQTMRGVDVVEAWRAVSQELSDCLAEMDDEQLDGLAAFPGEPPAPVRRHIEENTFGHLREHLGELRAWLEGES